MTKNIKLEITPIENKKQIFTELFNLRRASMRACNIASSLQFNELIMKQQNINISYNKSFQCYVEDKMKEAMCGYNTGNVAQTRAFVFSKANFNPISIKNGEESLSNYRLSNPIIIHNKSYVIYNNDNNWFVDISLFNREKQNDLGVKRISFKFNSIYKSAIPILIRLISKKYKQGSGQITYDERKKKWFIGISYSFELNKCNDLDINKVMGVDLGIVNVATYSIYNTSNNTYEYTKYNECMISGSELIHYRQTIDAKRKALQQATKWASENKIGHGRKQRMNDVDKIGSKCANFRDTYNHKVSRYLVDQAIKNHCGVIQMENLSGFSKEQENSMLKNWSYYDLQQKVKYKAEENGIKFRLINPKYTSKRCSICGKIHNLNRNCKENQSKFECVFCGNKMNADINASRNISIPDIEQLIKEEVSKSDLNYKAG